MVKRYSKRRTRSRRRTYRLRRTVSKRRSKTRRRRRTVSKRRKRRRTRRRKQYGGDGIDDIIAGMRQMGLVSACEEMVDLIQQCKPVPASLKQRCAGEYSIATGMNMDMAEFVVESDISSLHKQYCVRMQVNNRKRRRPGSVADKRRRTNGLVSGMKRMKI